MIRILVAYIALLQFRTTKPASNRHISSLNLLLPVSKSTNVVYELEAFNGCYDWTSSNSEVLSVRNVQTHTESNVPCYNKAVVRVESSVVHPGVIWLIAKDRLSGHMLKCESKVALVHRIEILTRLRTIYVDDFETLELIGYDAEGNSFSTLEGLKFDWHISQSQHLAEFWDFRDSGIKTTKIREDIERSGSRTDNVVLKGLTTGRITVSSAVKDLAYSNVSTEVVVHIIEHFVVVPEGNLYVLPCNKIQLKIFIIRTKDHQPIVTQLALPNPNYRFESNDPALGAVDTSGLLRTFTETGEFFLNVIDTKKEDNLLQKRVTIVKPWKILLNIRMLSQAEYEQLTSGEYDYLTDVYDRLEDYDNNWNLLKDMRYLIRPFLYDSSGNVIEISGVKLHWNVDKTLFNARFLPNNMVVVSPSSEPFSSNVEVELKDLECLDSYINATQEVTVQSPVAIIKTRTKEVILPVNGQYAAACIGGSKDHEWSISDDKVATIDHNGRIAALAYGTAVVHCVDAKNKHNSDSVSLTVDKYTALSVIEKKKEFMAKEARPFFISLTNERGSVFSNCTSVDIAAKAVKADFKITRRINEYAEMVKTIGSDKKARPEVYHKLGSSSEADLRSYQKYIDNKQYTREELEDLMAHYNNYGICTAYTGEGAEGDNQVLFTATALEPAKMLVQVYEPYRVSYQFDYNKEFFGETPLLMPHTSLGFELHNGPRAWGSAGTVKHKVAIEESQKAFFSSEEERNPNFLLVRLHCFNDAMKDEKRGRFTVTSANEADEELVSPIKLAIELTAICGHPAYVRIFEVQEENEVPAFSQYKPVLALRNSKTHLLKVWSFNQQHKAFWQQHSLKVSWQIDDKSIGHFKDSANTTTNLVLTERIGRTKARATSTGYLKSLSKRFEEIRDEIQISSLDLLAVEPSEVVLYYHERNQAVINIYNGSGYFRIATKTPDVVRTVYDSAKRELILIPLKIGETTIEIHDEQLAVADPVTCSIKVVRISRLELFADKALLKAGEPAQLEVKAYAGNGLIPANQMRYIDLVFKINGDISTDIDTRKMRLQLAKAGSYSITVESKENSVTSSPLYIDVYEPIWIFPSKIILLDGCKGFFEVKGGPSPQLRQKHNFSVKVSLPVSSLKLDRIDDTTYSVKPENKKSFGVTAQLLRTDDLSVVSEAKAAVLIEDLEDLHILGTGSLVEGTTGRYLAVPKTASGYVSPALCDIRFKLSYSHSEAATVNGYISDRSLGENPSLLGFNVNAMRQGSISIAVSAIYKERQERSSTIHVNVIENLNPDVKFALKADNCRSHALLLSVNSKYELHYHDPSVKQEVLYVDRAVKVLPNNIIEAGPKPGFDTLLIKKHKNYSYVAIRTDSPSSMIIENADAVNFMQTNTTTTLWVRALDDQGRMFANLPMNANVNVLNPSPQHIETMIDAQRGELTVRSSGEGKSFVFVASQEYPQLMDIVEVNVGPLIQPGGYMAVPLDATIRFRPVNISSMSALQSMQPDVMQIDELGHGIALKEGKTALKVRGYDAVTAEIDVVKVNNLKPKETNPLVVTNIVAGKNYKESYPFLFNLASNSRPIDIFRSSYVDYQYSVQCEANPPIFFLKPIETHETGAVGCELSFGKVDEVPVKSAMLTVKVLLPKGESVSKTIQFDIQPKFMVLNETKAIHLNKDLNAQELLIATQDKLSASSQGAFANYIRSSFDPKTSVQSVTITVPKEIASPLKDTLLLENMITGQKEQVALTYDPSSSVWTKLMNYVSYDINISFVDIVVIIFCFVIVGFVLFQMRRYKNSYQDQDVTISRFSHSKSKLH